VDFVGDNASWLTSLKSYTTGVATACTGVDMSTSLFPDVVPEIHANPEHAQIKG